MKKILDLLPKSGADAKVVAELNGQLLELQRAAFDWENEKRELRLEVEELSEQLRDKRRLVFRDNAWWDESKSALESAGRPREGPGGAHTHPSVAPGESNAVEEVQRYFPR